MYAALRQQPSDFELSDNSTRQDEARQGADPAQGCALQREILSASGMKTMLDGFRELFGISWHVRGFDALAAADAPRQRGRASRPLRPLDETLVVVELPLDRRGRLVGELVLGPFALSPSTRRGLGRLIGEPSRTASVVPARKSSVPKLSKKRVEHLLAYADKCRELVSGGAPAAQGRAEAESQGGDFLRDLHHVANNTLQAISALLGMHMSAAPSCHCGSAVSRLKDRIGTMAVVHDIVFRSGAPWAVDLKEVVRRIVERQRQLNSKKPGIEVEVQADAVNIGIGRAVPVALILNELVGNAYQHAFPHGEGGHVQISLRRRKGKIMLAVRDDGVGMRAAPRSDSEAPLGLIMVRALAGQMRGQATVRAGKETEVVVSFPYSRSDEDAEGRDDLFEPSECAASMQLLG